MTQVQKGKTVPVRPPATYFSYSPDDGYEEHDSPEKAKAAADAAIDAYRGEACDGWSDEVTGVTWGVVAQRATKFGERKRTNEDAHLSPEIQTVCDYYLAPEVTVPASLPFPATTALRMFAEMLACESIKSGNDDSWRSRASNAAVEYADIVDAENIAAGLTPLSPPADLMPRIYAEARRAYRQYRSGVSGQTVTDADNPDFLLVMAAWQMFVGLNSERQDGKKPESSD
ncbi:hypothetical protein ACM4N5_003810 [Escherichia coli]|uniref:hypothetical protein n=1 Tax=Enterobacteriaceae TaxID=543 RepID=UPI000F5E5AA5|nr:MULTISPECIES: hypothetical protein [Enterobacteriaceae]HCM5085230.1 hypothetical protein [Klebsiella aerogenes]MBL1695144.1 hypothetical protein [Klebsiella pneumoniae]MBL2251658.1 hypothetical protein [Klebsiella pneumoniae]MCB3248878.1 hypothetical protein [Klebsiella pneumoniae]MCB3249110.1 hypothetical protein [Klebsiella pneumoniae]